MSYLGNKMRQALYDAYSKAQSDSQYVNKVTDKADQTEVDDGVTDSKFVTPNKLKLGFSISLTQSGYIAFPSWFGGFMIQWGTAGGSNEGLYDLPTPFPSNFLWGIVADAGISQFYDHRIDIASSTTTQIYIASSSNNTETFTWLAIGK